MVQGIGPEFKPQYCKNKTKQNKKTHHHSKKKAAFQI
jgi:glutamine amidotransferase-like uncharacterized protein